MERAPGIQQRILVPLIVALLPAMAVLMAIGVAEWRDELGDLRAEQERAARVAAGREDALVDDAQRLTAALELLDGPGCSEDVASLLGGDPLFHGAGILGPGGTPRCTWGPAPGDVHLGAAWPRIREVDGFGLADFGTAGGSLVFLRAIDNGMAYAMVAPERFTHALEADGLLQGATILITDPEGLVLGASAPWDHATGYWIEPTPAIVSAMLQGEAAFLEAPALFGPGTRMWSHWILEGTEDSPVHIAIGIDPTEGRTAAANIMLINLLGAVGLVAGIGIVATVTLGRYVTRPVRNLATLASNAAPDDPVGDVPASMGVAELDALSESLHGARVRIHQELAARAKQQEELERSNRELAEFAFVASHDLQEPIRKVVSFNELLESQSARLDEEGRMLLERSLANARRSQALIKELLDFSRIDRPDLVREVDCGTIVAELLEDLGPDADRVQAGKLPTVQASPVQVRQVWHNLIENALKYTDGPIEVGHDTTCFVRDHGAGIEPEHREKVFQIFQRLHGKEVAGTGIGLAAVKKIIERHGGRIWVEDTPGGGATFRFTLET